MATRTSAACSRPRTRERGGWDAKIASRCRRRFRSRPSPNSNEGLVCLSGCARRGLGLLDPNAAVRLAGAFGRDRLLRRASAPVRARGHAPPDAPPRPRRAPRRGDSRDRRRPLAPSAPNAAARRPRRDPLPHLARGLRAGAPRQPRELPPPARGDARALPLRSRSCRAERPPRRAARVRSRRKSSATAIRTSRTRPIRRSPSSQPFARARSPSATRK